MRKLRPVVGILECIVNRLWHKFSVRNAIASQFVHHNLSWFAAMIFQKPLKETFCSSAIATGLDKHINHIAILVNSPPQVLLFSTYLYKHLVDVESIANSLMRYFQSFGILRAEVVAHRRIDS